MNTTEKAMIIGENIQNTKNVTDWTGGTTAIERLDVP